MNEPCCGPEDIDYTGRPKSTNVHLRTKDFRNKDAMFKVILKAKPKIFKATFLSGRHSVRGRSHIYGCMVEFPNEVVYFNEEDIGKYFEILKEED